MEAEVSQAAGAAYGERSGERVARRNGYRERAWDTRVGSIELAIPRLRSVSYFPSFLEPRRRSEQAPAALPGVKRDGTASRRPPATVGGRGAGRAFGACCFAGKLRSPAGPTPGPPWLEASTPYASGYASPYAGNPRTPFTVCSRIAAGHAPSGEM
jgi:hypothetical protein